MLPVLALVLLSATLSTTPAQRADATGLWIAHLDGFAAAHHELTTEQQATLADGRALLESGLLRRLHSTNATEAADAKRALDLFRARASNAFSTELYSEAFVRLAKAPSNRARTMFPYCDCNPAAGDCGGDCVTGSCRVMPEGCGLFGTDICTGLCQ